VLETFAARQPGERGIGDLKLFESQTMCLLIAVRDREER